ncbi:5242_t:CDS:2 [Entrophospora sp. SA101]|nr:5242_t:CDS:2 [Entrophospora sp. SA101]
MHDPDILVLDEPTSGLDPSYRGILLRQLEQVRQRGGTVLISSHILSDLQKLVDATTLIDKGKIVYTGEKPDDIEEMSIQPHKFTVQGYIETALSKIFQQKINILATSRTDKGVHAREQKFTLRLNLNFSEEKLFTLLKKIFSEHVLVKKVEKALYEARRKVKEVEGKLQSDNPILCGTPTTKLSVYYYDDYNSSLFPIAYGGIVGSEEIKRIELTGSDFYAAKNNPDDYFKPLDIVKIFAPHNKMIRYHPVIPFKHKDKIIEHIAKSITLRNGCSSSFKISSVSSEHNSNYNINYNNCEHMVNKCVLGLNFSEYAEKKNNWYTKELNISEKINETNREFDSKYNYKGNISEIRGYGERFFDVNRDGIKMDACVEVQPKPIIDESITRTPEERKWVEEQLNKERTPEELKKAVLGLEYEIFEKEVEEEHEYIKNHFFEIKRGIINIIKQNPQEWEIKEEEEARVILKMDLLKKNEPKLKIMKENYVCDACCQKQSYNIAFLVGVRDFINDTEIFLKRLRRLITKLPKFYDKLKEVEKSLILTDKEKQAEKKNHSFRINFLQEKNDGQQRDNIHLFKLCRKCLDELAEKEKIADEIGEEEWKRI